MRRRNITRGSVGSRPAKALPASQAGDAGARPAPWARSSRSATGLPEREAGQMGIRPAWPHHEQAARAADRRGLQQFQLHQRIPRESPSHPRQQVRGSTVDTKARRNRPDSPAAAAVVPGVGSACARASSSRACGNGTQPASVSCTLRLVRSNKATPGAVQEGDGLGQWGLRHRGSDCAARPGNARCLPRRRIAATATARWWIHSYTIH